MINLQIIYLSEHNSKMSAKMIYLSKRVKAPNKKLHKPTLPVDSSSLLLEKFVLCDEINAKIGT